MASLFRVHMVNVLVIVISWSGGSSRMSVVVSCCRISSVSSLVSGVCGILLKCLAISSRIERSIRSCSAITSCLCFAGMCTHEAPRMRRALPYRKRCFLRRCCAFISTPLVRNPSAATMPRAAQPGRLRRMPLANRSPCLRRTHQETSRLSVSGCSQRRDTVLASLFPHSTPPRALKPDVARDAPW